MPITILNDHENIEMVLRNEDKKWVQDTIAEAIESLRPRGWRKLIHLLRELGPVIGSVAFVTALIAILVTVGIFASSRLREESEFRGRTGERLNSIESGIKSLTATVEAIRLRQVSENPTDLKNIVEVKELLKTAKTAGTKLNEEVVKNAGAKFIRAVNKNPDAWSAAAAFVDYKSFLNTALPRGMQGLPQTTTVYDTTHYNVSSVDNQPRPKVGFLVGGVPRDKAAVYELIGEGLNEKNPVGDPYLVLQGGNTAIDNHQIKNVIFKNVNVLYYGGPVKLENVYFINCTFVIPRPLQATQSFASTFLESGPSVNFSDSRKG